MEDLERARVDTRRPAVRIDLRSRVHDAHPDSVSCQLAGHRETGGTGAHDEDWRRADRAHRFGGRLSNYCFSTVSPVTVASVLCANRIPHTPSMDLSFPAPTTSDLGYVATTV